MACRTFRVPPCSSRLRSLRTAGIIETAGREYYLTEAGRALAPVMRELARWATITESAALSQGDLDTAALTWDMRRRIDSVALPERTVVLAIEFTDRAADRNFWLHLSRAEVNLCRQDTGTPADVWLAAPTAEATRWWLGQQSWAQFVRNPDVSVHGDRDLQRQMHRWFLRYVFSPEALQQAGPAAGKAHQPGRTRPGSRTARDRDTGRGPAAAPAVLP